MYLLLAVARDLRLLSTFMYLLKTYEPKLCNNGS